jgi:hypothetical protein
MSTRWGGAVSGRCCSSLQDLREVKPKLPRDGQLWLDGMNRSELEAAQAILHLLGEEGFVEHWRFYEEQFEEIRPAYNGPKGW